MENPKHMKKIIKFFIQKCKKALKDFSLIISFFFTLIITNLIKFYSFFISPLLGTKCRYLPTCSEYFQESIKTFGAAKGSFLGLKRILKCHPIKFLGGGYGIDLVPKSTIKSKRT